MPLIRNDLRPKLALGLALCFLVGAGAFWYTDGFDFATAPPPPPVKTASALPKPVRSAPKSEPSVSVARPAMPEVNSGTLQSFSAKQAALEEAKLDVAIAEQQAKLRELREGKQQTSTPALSALPMLPPLPLLPEPSSGPAPVAMPVLPPIQRKAGLVTIQGVDGNLSAVFATAQGKKTVRVGDPWLGSRVRSITLDGVALQSGKAITFED